MHHLSTRTALKRVSFLSSPSQEVEEGVGGMFSDSSGALDLKFLCELHIKHPWPTVGPFEVVDIGAESWAVPLHVWVERNSRAAKKPKGYCREWHCAIKAREPSLTSIPVNILDCMRYSVYSLHSVSFPCWMLRLEFLFHIGSRKVQ